MSFDAYRIAVKLSLVNQVSNGLIGITADLKKTEGAASELHKKLALIGAAMAGTGAAMLLGLKGPMQMAMDYSRELAKLKQQGLGDFQIADARKFVEANDIVGTSLQQRMKLFVEAQGAFRESGMGGMEALKAAKVMSPLLAQYQVAGSLLDGPHRTAVEGSMRHLNKITEMAGGLGDTKRAADIVDGVFKAVQSSGKMVDERQLKQFVAYASSAGNQQNLRTIFGGLEPLIGELGGSTAAVGLRTAYTRTNGMMSLPPKLLIHEMQRLGMTDATGTKQNRALAELQSTNVISYAVEMMKRYEAAGIKTQTDRERENAIIFGTNGSKIFNKLMSQMPTIQRSLASYDQAHGIAQTINDNLDSPQMAVDKFSNALKDLGLVIGQTVLPVLTPMLQNLSSMFKSLKEYPTLVHGLTLGFAGLASTMLIGGSLLSLTNGLRALGGVFSLIGSAGGVFALGAASPIVLGVIALGAAAVGLVALLDHFKPDSKGQKEPLHRGGGAEHANRVWVAGHGPRGSGGHYEDQTVAASIPTYIAHPMSGGRNQIHTTINLDGKAIAKVVTDVQTRDMRSAGNAGGSSADSTRIVPTAALNYAR